RSNLLPQWSPSGEDGATTGRDQAEGDRGVAAMEPVRRGRGDGADVAKDAIAARCRNGARPERTGRLTIEPTAPAARVAAMEPVRRGRGDGNKAAAEYVGLSVPQWSPSGEDGATVAPWPVGGRPTCRNGARP